MSAQVLSHVCLLFDNVFEELHNNFVDSSLFISFGEASVQVLCSRTHV